MIDGFVTDVQFDDIGRLWVATDGGAVVWRGQFEDEFHSILARAQEPPGHGLGYVRVIRFDHAGRLWIGAREGGVALFDPKNGHLVRLRHKVADPGSRRLRDEVNTRTRELAARNTELERVNGRLERGSMTDPLTGLGNRRALIKEMPQLLAQLDEARLRSAGMARLTLMLVDLDRLKPINDEHGHEAGDVALEAVAKLLRRCLRKTDRVVRWGGDGHGGTGLDLQDF